MGSSLLFLIGVPFFLIGVPSLSRIRQAVLPER